METFIHNYRGYGIHPSRCRIYIKEVKDEIWVGFENMGGGTSVTNVSEQLATEIVEKKNLNPSDCRFFEWYPEYENDVDEIFYEWRDGEASNPKWKHRNSSIKDVWNG